jgi:hypothetical protein
MMRKVKPVFDTNDTVCTYAYWRVDFYPFVAGARIVGVAPIGEFLVDVAGAQIGLSEAQILFALKLADAVKLNTEIADMRLRYDRAHATLEATMANVRKRTHLNELDPR